LQHLEVFLLLQIYNFNFYTSPFPGGSVHGGYGGNGGHGGNERFNGTTPLGLVATVLRLLSYLVRRLVSALLSKIGY
jgi:hypothetical protein